MKNSLLGKGKEKEKDEEIPKKGLNIYEHLEGTHDQITLALPSFMKGQEDKFIRVCKTEMRKSDKLLNACKNNKNGFLGAFMTACEIGLKIGGVLGECYLIPVKNDKKGRYDIELIISYQGLMILAKRGGARKIEIFPIYEEEVKKGNIKVKYGINEAFDYEPILIGEKGKKVGYMAYAVLENGENRFEFYDMEFIEKRKKYAISKAYNGYHKGWDKWEDEFERKTVVRHFCKILGLSMEETEKDNKTYEYDEVEKVVEEVGGEEIPKEDPKADTGGVIEGEVIEKLSKEDRIRKLMEKESDLLNVARKVLSKPRMKLLTRLGEEDITILEVVVNGSSETDQ